MSNELVPAELQSAVVDMKQMSRMTSSGFLPRVQLVATNAKIAQQKKAEGGHFALVDGDKVTDLGESTNFVVFASRFKAMDFTDMLTFFNPETDSFKDVVHRAENTKNSGCGYGPEFLVFVPETKQFATFFFSSSTLRRESENILACMNGMCKVKARFIDPSNSKFSWWGCDATMSERTCELPSAQDCSEVIKDFMNPKESEVEIVEETSSRKR